MNHEINSEVWTMSKEEFNMANFRANIIIIVISAAIIITVKKHTRVKDYYKR